MTSNKPPLNLSQVAVVVNISGVQCRLLAAKDRKEKGAVFFPLSPINLEDGGESIPVKEEHISIWPNIESKNIHVHHTYRLSHPDVWKIDYSLLVDNSNSDFASAFMARTVNARPNRQPDKINTNKYSVIEIPSYNELESTLIVCYTSCLNGYDIPDLSSQGVSRVILVFTNITVVLYYTYLSLPSYVRGRVSELSSSFVRVNDGPTFPVGGGPSAKDFKSFVEMMVHSVSEAYIELINFSLYEVGNPTRFRSEDIGNTTVPLSKLRADGQNVFFTRHGPMEFKV